MYMEANLLKNINKYSKNRSSNNSTRIARSGK